MGDVFSRLFDGLKKKRTQHEPEPTLRIHDSNTGPGEDVVELPPALGPRRLILALDYGAAFNKAVLRDSARSISLPVPVVNLPDGAGPGNPFGRPLPLQDDVSPSRLTILDGRIFFGWQGEGLAHRTGAIALSSLKGTMGQGEALEKNLPEGFSLQDLVFLEMFHLAWRGWHFAKKWDSEAELRYVLALPKGYGHLRKIMEGAVAILQSDDVPYLGDGLTVASAKTLVADAKNAALFDRSQLATVDEGDAALQYFARASRLPDGLFAAVGIGASRSEALFFEMKRPIRRMDVPGVVTVLGRADLLQGSDTLTKALAKAEGRTDYSLLRGNEGPKFVYHRDTCSVVRDDFLRRIKAIYGESYNQALKAGDWGEPLKAGDYGLLLFGGGSWLRPIREPMLTRASADVAQDPSLVEPGKPFDLRGSDGGPHRGDAYFLHAAYGAGILEELALASTP